MSKKRKDGIKNSGLRVDIELEPRREYAKCHAQVTISDFIVPVEMVVPVF